MNKKAPTLSDIAFGQFFPQLNFDKELEKKIKENMGGSTQDFLLPEIQGSDGGKKMSELERNLTSANGIIAKNLPKVLLGSDFLIQEELKNMVWLVMDYYYL